MAAVAATLVREQRGLRCLRILKNVFITNYRTLHFHVN